MILAHPFWLLALLLIPAVVIVAILASRMRARRWNALAAARLRPTLVHRGPGWPRWVSLTATAVAFAALVIALARPQFEGGTRSQTIKGRNILIALDLSRSMQVSDVKPSRLAQAKTITYELLDALPNDRIGVIAFTSTAVLAAPFTIDHSAIRETIEQLDEHSMPTSGSDIEAALKLALNTFKDSGEGNHALVVLSDGEENEGKISGVLKDLDQEKIRIFAIGFGTEEGGIVPDQNSRDGRYYDPRTGNTVLSRINHESLRDLAKETGGRYLPATSNASISETVRSATSDLAEQKVAEREERIMIELFPWFIAPALCLLLITILADTRWRKLGASSAALAPLFLFLLAPETNAQEAVTNPYQEKADRAWTQESRSRWRLGEGVFDSEHGARKKATSAFSEGLMSKSPSVRATTHHNLGTNLFHEGWERLSEGQPYPRNDGVPDTFDRLVGEKIKEALLGEAPEEVDDKTKKKPFSIKDFDKILTDWTDAVRHYDSALELQPQRSDSEKNRELTLYYLKRLKELLEIINQQTQQQIPMQGQGGQPQEKQDQSGEQEGDQPEQGNQNQDPNQQGESGDQGDEKKDSPEGEGDEEDQNNKGKGDQPDKEQEGQGKEQNEGKTPEEEAREKLKENADVEQGSLFGPGRQHYERPVKDW